MTSMFWEEMEFRYCFARGTLTPALMAEVLRDYPLGFAPRWISGVLGSRHWRRFRPEQHLAAIASMKNLRGLRVCSEQNGREGLSIATIANWDVQTVHCNLKFEGSDAFRAVDLFMRSPGFHAAFSFNTSYHHWQSVRDVNVYEVFGKPHGHLPKVRDPDLDELVIDVRHNPGRMSLLPNMWLLAAWRMWFAPASFRHLPRDRLLAFDGASRVEELASGGVFVELYEDPRSAGSAETQAREAAFRRWMHLDDLEDRARDLQCRSDPVYEIRTGRFDHGGERLLITYLGADKRPTEKSQAVYVWQCETAMDGTVLHKSTQRVDGGAE